MASYAAVYILTSTYVTVPAPALVIEYVLWADAPAAMWPLLANPGRVSARPMTVPEMVPFAEGKIAERVGRIKWSNWPPPVEDDLLTLLGQYTEEIGGPQAITLAFPAGQVYSAVTRSWSAFGEPVSQDVQTVMDALAQADVDITIITATQVRRIVIGIARRLLRRGLFL